MVQNNFFSESSNSEKFFSKFCEYARWIWMKIVSASQSHLCHAYGFEGNIQAILGYFGLRGNEG